MSRRVHPDAERGPLRAPAAAQPAAAVCGKRGRPQLNCPTRRVMSMAYLPLLFIMTTFISNCFALSWNAQGPVKVEDVYSCENIPSTSRHFRLHPNSFHVWRSPLFLPSPTQTNILRFRMAFFIQNYLLNVLKNLLASPQTLSLLVPSQTSSSATISPSSERYGFLLQSFSESNTH